MTFVAGILLGVVGGAAITGLLIRRKTGARGLGFDRRGIAVAVAALALVVAAIALVRRDHHDHDTGAAAVPTSTAPTTTAPSATTPVTTARATVTVPKLVGETRTAALAALRNLGLHPSVETIALNTVPPGFVLSQNPVTATVVAPGSTVLLVISAAT